MLQGKRQVAKQGSTGHKMRSRNRATAGPTARTGCPCTRCPRITAAPPVPQQATPSESQDGRPQPARMLRWGRREGSSVPGAKSKGPPARNQKGLPGGRACCAGVPGAKQKGWRHASPHTGMECGEGSGDGKWKGQWDCHATERRETGQGGGCGGVAWQVTAPAAVSPGSRSGSGGSKVVQVCHLMPPRALLHEF